MAQRDLYDVLGADKKATPDELKAAFRRAAKACHPDHNPQDRDATKNFQEINKAYQTLRNPTERARYDRTESSRRDAGREWERNEQARAEREAKAQAEKESRVKAEQEAKLKTEAEATRKAEQERVANAVQEAQRKAEAERQAATERKAKEEAEARRQAKAKREVEAAQRAAAERRDREQAEVRRRAEAQRVFQQEQERSEQIFQEVLARFTEDPDTFYPVQRPASYASRSVLTKEGADCLTYDYADALNNSFAQWNQKKAEEYLVKFKPAQISAALDLYQKRTCALIVQQTQKIAQARQDVVEQAASLSTRLKQIAKAFEAAEQLNSKLSDLSRDVHPLSFLDNVHRYLEQEDMEYADAKKVGARILENRERLQKLEQIKPTVAVYENTWQNFVEKVRSGSGQYHLSDLDWIGKIRDTLFPSRSRYEPVFSDQEKLKKVINIFQKNSLSKKTVSGIFGGNQKREAFLAEAEAMLPKLAEKAAVISLHFEYPFSSSLENKICDLTRSLKSDTNSLQTALLNLRKANATGFFKYEPWGIECLKSLLNLPKIPDHGLLSKDLRTVLQAICHSHESGQSLLKCVDGETLRHICSPQQVASAIENFETISSGLSNELRHNRHNQNAISNDIRALQELVEILDKPLAPKNRVQIHDWQNSIEKLKYKVKSVSANYGINICNVEGDTRQSKAVRPGAKYTAQSERTAAVS